MNEILNKFLFVDHLQKKTKKEDKSLKKPEIHDIFVKPN